MRSFSKYSFVIGNRTFSEVLEIVDAFLRTNGLSYQNMGYRISDSDVDKAFRVRMAKNKRMIPNRKSATVLDLHDLLNDYPQLGSIQTVNEREVTEIILTNMDTFGNCMSNACAEDYLRQIAANYPIPYFLSDFMLFYLNVDFFGKQRETVEESCWGLRYHWLNRKGNYIAISKQCDESIKLIMMAEISVESEQTDIYAQSLGAMLGKKYTSETVLLMTPEEKEAYQQLEESAEGLAESVRDEIEKLTSLYPLPTCRYTLDMTRGSFSVPKSLKRIGKKFGFTKYRYDFYNVFFLSKYTKEGHLLTLVVDSPSGFCELRFSVNLTGLGFQHRFHIGDFSAANQEIADQLMEASFEMIQQLAESSLADLCQHYPSTPAWFMPNEWLQTTF